MMSATINNNNSYNATHHTADTQTQPLNLYEMLGGESIIRAAVDAVSQRVVHDTVLRFFVSRHELKAGKESIVQFFTSALIYGIPDDASLVDEAIIDQLKRLFTLGFSEQHFDQILGHLLLTLESFGVTRSMVVEVARTIMPLRSAFESGAKQAKSRQAGSRMCLSF